MGGGNFQEIRLQGSQYHSTIRKIANEQQRSISLRGYVSAFFGQLVYACVCACMPEGDGERE